MRKSAIVLVGLCLTTACTVPASSHPHPEAGAKACVPAGQWLDPATGAAIDDEGAIATMAKRPVVLLGETHTNPEHHQWQLHTLAALHGRHPNMVLGFEAFPRRVQPALDRWSRGELGVAEFLKESEWYNVWRFDHHLYLPLFQFARMHRIPMVALNVDQSLISRVRQDGWDAVPADAREGVGDPAPATPAFIEYHADIYTQHEKRETGAEASHEPRPVDVEDPDFLKFVDAMRTWDRAMAEALAAARSRQGRPLVVGIAGRGHLQYKFGVVHQLAALGIPDAAVLLPWDPDMPCADLAPAGGLVVADAVFGVDAPPAAAVHGRPLLGVRIENHDHGVRVIDVVADSVAEAAGLKKDDVITNAAGLAVTKVGELVATVRRQAPGTWLPLTVKRGGQPIDVIAKFPPGPL